MRQVIFLLRTYNSVQNFVHVAVSNALYVYGSLIAAFSPKNYVCFEDLGTPYLQQTVSVERSSAVPQWSYSEEKHIFTEWGNTLELTPKSLPILSMSIVNENTVVHDISDFVETLRVRHSAKDTFPSVAHILGAWSLTSGVVLNPTNSYFAKMITTSAETVAVPINTHEYFTVVKEESTLEGVD